MTFTSTNEERRKLIVSAMNMDSPQYVSYGGENYMCWRIVMADNPELANKKVDELSHLPGYIEKAGPVAQELISYISSTLGEDVVVDFDPDDESTAEFNPNDLRNFWFNQMLTGIYLDNLSGVIDFYKYSK